MEKLQEQIALLTQNFNTMNVMALGMNSDEDTTTCSKSNEEHLSNYVAFTSKVNMEDVESDTNEAFEGMSDIEFLKTYNTMLNKQVEAKESQLDIKIENLEKIQKELESTKLMLKKLSTNSEKFDEILVARRRSLAN
ncbi:hypothetical protein Gotur_009176 [Gossypium turneri]